MPYEPSRQAQKLIDRLVGPESIPATEPPKPLPRHVAIIMDGNGRWAEERGLPRNEGHRAGIESVRTASRACRKLEIPYLTLYSFSTENWKRPRAEVAFLMRMLRNFLREEIPEMKENKIRLSAIGDLKKLPLYAQHELKRTRKITADGHIMQLNLALSYGSRDEITRAVQKIARKVKQGKMKLSEITEESLSDHLDTANMPDPDLLIRTSGDLRVSNFLLWQISYAEIHVTDLRWPDFQDIHFYEAILDYMGRDRRFGKVKS